MLSPLGQGLRVISGGSGDTRPYKVLVVKLSGFSAGNAPSVINVLENTLGGAPTVARLLAGFYGITVTSAFPVASKVVGFLSFNGIYAWIFDYLDANRMYFATYNGFLSSNNVDITNGAVAVTVEIHVYP